MLGGTCLLFDVLATRASSEAGASRAITVARNFISTDLDPAVPLGAPPRAPAQMQARLIGARWTQPRPQCDS